ncbi:gliding motility-associated C-terminal domain-containing protein [uncultured Dokdonia sp.]|uniref:T9SS type B sorting domain-containing protein n=1 Tax=uncultured Dokdonia sp. TaxID=575653 RepID=UPI0026352BD1|nr:gliding motility-associated C-terminal domain-containing protein [uncultured Dokdonia sp.]
MQKNYYKILLVFLLISPFLEAQEIEQFTIFAGRFDYTAIGNTLNTDENGGGAPCEILTESAATLTLAPDQTVEAAYLYWAGSGTGDFDITLNDIPLTAERTFADQIDDDRVFFAGFVDVTTMVQTIGSGEYIFGDLDLTDAITPFCSTGTNFGGWAITVIFEDPDLPLNLVNVFDGLENVSQFNNELTIELENLNVLDNENARIGFVAWEGDAGIAVNETLSINGNILSNPPLNPADNQFNGTNSFTGQDDLYNMDIDFYSIENNINIGDTSATILLTSGQDFVMINNIITVLNSQLPDGVIAIDTFDVACGSRDVEITYTVSNLGTDPLPVGTSVAFYADAVLAGTTITTAEILPDASLSGLITLTIPNGIPDIFTLIAVVDDDGTGNGEVTETNEVNNESSEVSINLNVIDIETPLLDVSVCDDESNDEIAFFDLTVIGDMAVGGQTGVIVTYHETEGDAIAGSNPITNPDSYANSTNPQQIFVRFRLEADPLCTRIESFMISVAAQPVIPDLEDTIVCDDESNDETAIFNLSSQNGTIIGTQTDVFIQFYTSLVNAQTNTDPIANPTSFQNTSNPQTIFVRLSNTLAEDCFDVSSFQLIVEDVPVIANALGNLLVCDDQNNDGLFTFDLTINEVLAIGNQSNVTVTFHLTEADATNGDDAIPNPDSFDNTMSPQTIYLRIVQNDDAICVTTDSFLLEVFDQPIIPSLNDIVACDDSSNDGILLFDLTQQQATIVDGQEDFTVSFHTTLEDAQNNIGGIQNPEVYQNIENPQTIYVRLENPDNTACFDLGIFGIEALTIDPPQLLPAIEACNEGFEMATFDLVLAAEDIVLLDDEVITGYYENPDDAFNEVNQIENPFIYTNSTNPQTIYIRTDSPNSDSCYNLAQFTITIENCPPFVPDGFSPNGDSINDVFEISNLKDVFDYELTIYSRLGNLIYSGDNEVPFWDGIPNQGIGGNEAPTGVYFWVLKLRDPNIDDMVGWVYLNR